MKREIERILPTRFDPHFKAWILPYYTGLKYNQLLPAKRTRSHHASHAKLA